MGSARKTHRVQGKPPPQLRSRTTRSSKGRLLTSTDPAHSTALLTSQLRSLGLYPAPTLGDGNCLFRALSDQLHGSPARHFELRAQICDWIERHRERYEPFVEDDRGLGVHLRCMRENGTYGGHMELSAFAHLSRRNVKVIQPGLVYVIEWAAGGDPSSSSSSLPSSPSSSSSSSSLSSLSPDSDPGLDDEAADDPTLTDRDRRRARRTRVRVEKEKKIKISLSQTPSPAIAEGDDDDSTQDAGTIYVAYHDWEHFSSIRNLRGPHTGLPFVKETPPPPLSSVSSPTSLVETGPKKGVGKGKKVTLKLGVPSPTPSMPTASAKSKSKSSATLKPLLLERRTDAMDTTPDPDPAQIPLPSSRSASPFPPSSDSASSTSPASSSTQSTSKQHPHPLRTSSIPSHTHPHYLPSPSSVPTIPTQLYAQPQGRATRSPKRTFAESGGESEGSSGGAAEKRTRRPGRCARTGANGVDDAMDVDVDVDANVDVDGEGDTPGLSAPGSSSSSSSTLSSSLSSEAEDDGEGEEGVGDEDAAGSSPEPERRPKRALPPKKGAKAKYTPASVPATPIQLDRPLTRRQRKALGLPKPRAALPLGGRGTGAGKIVIPGGRYKKGAGARGVAVKEVDDDYAYGQGGDAGDGQEGQGGEGNGEWKRNGAGRVDVRGFRELRI